MANAAEQMARNVNLGTFAKAKDLQNRILSLEAETTVLKDEIRELKGAMESVKMH